MVAKTVSLRNTGCGGREPRDSERNSEAAGVTRYAKYSLARLQLYSMHALSARRDAAIRIHIGTLCRGSPNGRGDHADMGSKRNSRKGAVHIQHISDYGDKQAGNSKRARYIKFFF